MTAARFIHSATALDARGTKADSWILSDDKRILQVGQGREWPALDGDVDIIDATGLYLTPGLIDIHCHGGGGYANEEGTYALLGALAAHHKHGVTRMVASFVTAPHEHLVGSLQAVAALSADYPLLLGSHLEGPFLNHGRRGAHSSAHLRQPTPTQIRELLDAARGTLRQITIDPALPGAQQAIQDLQAAGVRVAIGHSEIGYEAAAEAIALGATLLTHTFNAMPGIHHREPGPIVASIENDSVFLELILDNEHVHPSVASLLFKAAPSRVVLITDAMAASCGHDGMYALGDLSVEVSHGRAVIAGTDTLAGSTLTLDTALKNGLAAGLSAQVVVEALTLTPARALGLEQQFGLLEPGYAPDLVLYDRSWSVLKCYAMGQELYSDSERTLPSIGASL